MRSFSIVPAAALVHSAPRMVNFSRMKKYLVAGSVFLVAAAAVAGFVFFSDREAVVPAGSGIARTDVAESDEVRTVDESELPAAPAVRSAWNPSEGYPTYLFLFTHTEDHVNHELSEERYTRIGPMLENLQDAYPDEDITWTIEFQGADAKTVADRDGSTGVATYLRALADRGLVEFGYHAHHDPTYLNRPQKGLDERSSWDEVYDAILSWVSCEKDPLKGGCVAATGGGAMAVAENFGPVQIVTGVGTGEGAQIERSAGAAAIRSRVPDRMVGFGFPDHGATLRDTGYTDARDALMRLLTPADDTTSTVFWMDNSIRINDGVPLEGVSSLTLREGVKSVQSELAELDDGHVNVINTGIADKFLYATPRSSPTVWAYAHPDDPELSGKMLLSEEERERGYVQTEQALSYLLGTYLADRPETSGFVSADQVAKLVTSEDYWTVDDAELQAISASIVRNWDDRPPTYAYDGRDYYSLADSFGLLVSALGGRDGDGTVSAWYGPWSLSESIAPAALIRGEDLLSFAVEFGEGTEITPSYEIGGTSYAAGQVLYAMAFQFLLHADDRFDGTWNAVEVPKTRSVPEAYGLLEDLGCVGCADTSWSLKPARFDVE